MPTILDTVTQAEDKVLETIGSVQEPVVEYVKKAVDYVNGVLPEDRPTLPFADQLPSAAEIVDTQFAFATKLLKAQHDFAKAIVEATAPLTGRPAAKPRVAKKAPVAAA